MTPPSARPPSHVATAQSAKEIAPIGASASWESAVVVPAADQQHLTPAINAKKGDPQHVRCRHGPDSLVLAVKRVNPQRRVLLVIIKQTERLQELSPLLGREVAIGEARQESLAEL